MTTPMPKKSKDGLFIGAAALLGALLVGGGMYWWSAQDTDSTTTSETRGASFEETEPEPEAAPETTDANEPDAELAEDESASGDDETDRGDESALGDHAVCPSGTPEVVCEAAAFVETQRGRAFKSFPLVELSDPDEFEQRLLADFDDYAEELAADGDTMRALGLIPADADLVELFRESLSVGVVGFYDTETQELVIKGADLNLYAELVIVHELTHAFDDQWFDLDRPEFDDVDDDASYGISAVIEGNASRVEEAWRRALSTDESSQLTAEEFGLFSQEDIERYLAIPEFILNLQISPYVDGESFVQAIADAGGEDAVDDLFLNPPRSSEQALHVDKFQADEAPILVPPFDPPGEIIDEGPLGEIVIREWLGQAAAEGWGGDSYVTWDAGEGQVCIDARFVADTDGDRDELRQELDAWASEQADRSVEVADGVITARGCN